MVPKSGNRFSEKIMPKCKIERIAARKSRTDPPRPHNSVTAMCDMCDQKASSSTLAPPRCPSCAQPMRLAKRVTRFDGLPDLATFECRACGVSHIEAL